MRQSTDKITVICESCSYESEEQIGRLQNRAGRSDFICSQCHTPFQDYTAQLEFICNDTSHFVHKLRLKPRRV